MKLLQCLVWFTGGVTGSYLINSLNAPTVCKVSDHAVMVVVVSLIMAVSLLFKMIEFNSTLKSVRTKRIKLVKYWFSFIAGITFANVFLSNGLWG